MKINGKEYTIVPRADLSGADLSGADLSAADLSRANLTEASLTGASLSRADLSRADLSRADLSAANLYRADLYRANLSGANLYGANLYRADLYRADLYRADLTGANLSGADLTGASLSGADLSGADLYGANLYGADLYGAINIPGLTRAQLSILPDGDLIGWKKCISGVLVKLRIPAEARRSNAPGRKCRAEYAEVLKVIGAKEGVSSHDPDFRYRQGETVRPNHWDSNWTVECGGGIHFYITREEAEAH